MTVAQARDDDRDAEIVAVLVLLLRWARETERLLIRALRGGDAVAPIERAAQIGTARRILAERAALLARLLAAPVTTALRRAMQRGTASATKRIAALGVSSTDVRPEMVLALATAALSRAAIPDTIRRAVQDAETRVLAPSLAARAEPEIVARQTADRVRARAEIAVSEATILAASMAAAHVYQQSGVTGATRFERVARLDARTCPMCLSLDGEILDDPAQMARHVNCRCQAVPLPIGRSAASDRDIGRDWLARQPEATQRQVLGAGGYARYQGGQPLRDWVEITQDPMWGPRIRRRPLRDM